jgi:hypothetical protein
MKLDHGQREVHRDVQHVPPTRLIGELGTEHVEDASAERSIRVRGRPFGLADEHAPALDPGEGA